MSNTNDKKPIPAELILVNIDDAPDPSEEQAEQEAWEVLVEVWRQIFGAGKIDFPA